MNTQQTDVTIALTEANFASVVGQSRDVPVLVDFWADWCAPCKQMAPVFDKLAREFRGRVIFAKVDADREPVIVQQFGVRGLPTLKLVFQGRLAGELVGAQTEAAIRQLLAQFVGDNPAVEEEGERTFLDRVRDAIEGGHIEDAVAALQAQLVDEKDDHRSRSLLVDLLLQEDRVDDAEHVLADAPQVNELKRARASVTFAKRLSDVPPLHDLERQVAATPSTDIRFHFALRLVGANRLEEGMDTLLQIMRSDRQFGDDAARKVLIDVFEMLGRDDALTVQYRRKMASLLN